MPTITAGLDNDFYLNTGTHGTPVWALQSAVKDLSLSISKTESPANDRGSSFDMQIEGLIKSPIKFSYLRDADLTNYALWRSAALSRGTVLDCAVASGPIATTGTIYFRADFACFGLDQKEDLEDPVMADISINLVKSANVPTIVTVS